MALSSSSSSFSSISPSLDKASAGAVSATGIVEHGGQQRQVFPLGVWNGGWDTPEATFQLAAQPHADGAQALFMRYGWDIVEEVDDSLYEPLRELIRAAKAEIDTLL